MENPLPCPFCGAEPDVREALNIKDIYCVVCSNFDEKEGCEIMPATKWYLPAKEADGKTHAISAWNRRANKASTGRAKRGAKSKSLNGKGGPKAAHQ